VDSLAGGKNRRTGLLPVLEKAGIPAWTAPIRNPLARRESQLMRQEPAHLVHATVGSSGRVAEDDYLMVTAENFDRTAG
jgi:hypothetical protein